MPRDRGLCELIKAKENIKRKYSALKHNEADLQSGTLNQSKVPPEEKGELIQNFIKEEEEEKQNVTEESINMKKNYESLLENWFNSPDFDKTYGPKKIYNQIVLGNNVVKFAGENVIACIVERLKRTLKENMFRAFTANGSREWISILPQLIEKYNNSKHRTIGMTPIQADKNSPSVILNQRNIPVRKKKFIVGDKVRVSVNNGVFTKGYLPKWSTEIFNLVKINNTSPFTYQLEDYKGNPIVGCFYAEEINKTTFLHDYLVEKIRRNGEVSIAG
ncbi:Ribonuclease H-like domain [Cinara cedri]|uniref:Ribonuclease H-like domain n=1 Tax=Cinara cedri TaxID=506608 RepID=A0A5E4NLE2_9HEMI|nr:Ribonuclease H-like domain [Cinara cedri]